MREAPGFTLIELLVVLAILSIVLAVAVPGMSDYLDRRKIINAAEALYGKFQYAKSEAVARSENVSVAFHIDAGDNRIWNIGVSTTAGCDPTITDVTNASACVLVVDDGDGVADNDDLVRHVTSSTGFPGVRLALQDFTGTETVFDFVRGTVDDAGTVRLTYARGDGGTYEMRVRLGMVGRAVICTPSGANAVAGYTTC